MKPEILKLIRSKLDLTQKQASEIIEVSDKTWQQWESGKTEMHPAYYSFLQEKLKDKIINTPSGVHINRIGYFYVHMIPFNIKWYTIKKIKKYHPTFIPTEASIFKFWTMDFHFSRNFVNEIQKRVKDGYRYLNMIKGISRTDYYYLGVNKYSLKQKKKYAKINNF